MNNKHTNPFQSGTANSNNFRIPALITLKSGRVLAFTDVRYSNGTDNPANIETAMRYSDDGGKTWSDAVLINHFDDMEDEDFNKAIPSSACFIDSAVTESESGIIYHACDACPAFMGLWATGRYGESNGFIDGKLALCDKTNDNKIECKTLDQCHYPYYIGEFIERGYAPVLKFENGENYNNYYVNKDYNLYKYSSSEFEPIMINQLKKDGSVSEKKVIANIFYALSPLKIYPTYYLWVKKSTDGGISWSNAKILNPEVDSKGFTGFAPGRAVATNHDGKERIIFPVYDNNDATEYASVVYTDDGENWHRSKKANSVNSAGKSSESQIVELNNGILRMFSRNTADYICYSDSTDGGVTWSEYKLDKSLKYCSNCQFSVVNYSKKIDGKNAIIISYPSEKIRKRGIIKIGLYDSNNAIEWKYTKLITDSLIPFSYVYSCLTEEKDGSVLLLYESDKAKLSIKNFSLKELKSNDKTTLTKLEKIKSKLLNIIKK